MSDATSTQSGNDRQLTAAIADIRARIERFIQQSAGKAPVAVGAPTAPPPGKTVSRSMLQSLLGKPAATRTPPPTSPPSADAPPPPTENPSALAYLTDRLGLSPFERDVLLLCAAMELDTRIASLCARAHDDPSKPYPTFALALALFDQPSWDVLSPERPLRYWRLIEINQPAAQPLTTSALRADERIVNFLKGLNYLDDRLAPMFTPLPAETGPAELSPSQSAAVDLILARWQQAAADGPLPVAQLLGADPVSKQLVAGAAAARLRRYLYRLPVELLPAAPAELESLGRLWQRESRLLPLALYLDAEEADAASTARTGPLARLLARHDGIFFLGIREVFPRLGRDALALDITRPAAAEQQSAWTDALGADAPASPALLAAQFNFNLPDLRRLARRARAEASPPDGLLPETIWDACCADERPRLDALAQRLDPKMTWDDLVLPPDETNLLRQIAAQVAFRNKVYGEWGFDQKMNRGFGISALFAGDSGTGKTMAAEVIANSLRLNLYRIDLSAVVNKYIGETEKNLRRLFDAAEDGGVILFFDEADALFGKRSEVKDSHDRYANIEINYLLQRLEAYRGLAILATNMKAALDAAFQRRLRFIVNFPFPGVAERRRLWTRAFLQAEAAASRPAPPLGNLDYDRLARLNLTGGSIHNVALNAAFLAAHAGGAVTMPLILSAARAEYLKLDRPINEADFRWSEPAALTAKPVPPTAEPVPA